MEPDVRTHRRPAVPRDGAVPERDGRRQRERRRRSQRHRQGILRGRPRSLARARPRSGWRPGERVAIIAESRPEWLSVDLAVAGRAARFRFPSIPRLAAAQVRYILQDSAAAIAVVSTRLQLEKIQEIRHQLPALQAIVVMDAAAAGNTPSVVSLAEATERGHARMVGEWGVAKQFRDAARAIRPGPARDDHLHVRHDRRAEGRDADACRARVEPASPPRRSSRSRRATSACRSFR